MTMSVTKAVEIGRPAAKSSDFIVAHWFIMTLPKPDKLPAEAFETGTRLTDDELPALKACIKGEAK
jgi:hypothetical protein